MNVKITIDGATLYASCAGRDILRICWMPSQAPWEVNVYGPWANKIFPEEISLSRERIATMTDVLRKHYPEYNPSPVEEMDHTRSFEEYKQAIEHAVKVLHRLFGADAVGHAPLQMLMMKDVLKMRGQKDAEDCVATHTTHAN